MELNQIASMIDQTLLKPSATPEQIRKFCEEAKLYPFAAVCINPLYVSLAAGILDRLTDLMDDPGSERCFEAYRARSVVLGRRVTLLSPGQEPVGAEVLDLERLEALASV